ncbi:hypothetical protein TNCV_4990441 [Trichonephila clavipes]|nr:hypothetical protein TNCV_4990441 [Trichonephila clavipes]
MTHSELPFVQGEFKHLFKEKNLAESFGNSPDTHNTKQNSTDYKTSCTSTDNRYGRITLLLWTLKMAPFWEATKEFRRKAAPISALKSPTSSALSDTRKTELIAQSLESISFK